MNNCLNCKEDYEAQRPTSKFCSDNCRVKYHKKNKRAAKAVLSPEQRLNIVYNKILEVLDNPAVKELKGRTVSDLLNYGVTDVKIPPQVVQKIVPRDFTYYARRIRECESPEEYAPLKQEINEALHLTTKQKQSLLNNQF